MRPPVFVNAQQVPGQAVCKEKAFQIASCPWQGFRQDENRLTAGESFDI